jgi:hypothetical protein
VKDIGQRRRQTGRHALERECGKSRPCR